MKKYKLILDNFISKFEAGVIAPGDKLPTEQQLMDTYKVSRITVRTALDELTKRGLISRTAGKGTFYIGENVGKEKKKIIIALIILHTVSELMKIAEGINDVITDPDISVTTYISNGNPQKERDLCQKAIDDGADGIIIFPTDEVSNKDYYSSLIYNKFPIVFLDRSPIKNCNIVQSNSELGMYMMTEHLLENGHRNIAYITSFSVSTLRERFLGFVLAMKHHNMQIRAENIKKLQKTPSSVSDDPTHIYAAVNELLSKQTPPTAIICSNDIIALHAITALKRAGEYFERISVTGFDNANYSSKNAYSITTVEQNFYGIGKESAILVLDAINNRKNNLTRIKTPIKLISRDSVKRICDKPDEI